MCVNACKTNSTHILITCDDSDDGFAKELSFLMSCIYEKLWAYVNKNDND